MRRVERVKLAPRVNVCTNTFFGCLSDLLSRFHFCFRLSFAENFGFQVDEAEFGFPAWLMQQAQIGDVEGEFFHFGFGIRCELAGGVGGIEGPDRALAAQSILRIRYLNGGELRADLCDAEL